jgi:hypothetical protein
VVELAHQELDVLFMALPLREVVEMADDAGPAVGQRDALEPPVVGLGLADVRALLDAARPRKGSPVASVWRKRRVASLAKGSRQMVCSTSAKSRPMSGRTFSNTFCAPSLTRTRRKSASTA